MLAFVGVCSLAGGGISAEIVIACVSLLLVMAVCTVIGDDDLFEALMKPSKKKKTYMESYRQHLDYAFGKKKNRP